MIGNTFSYMLIRCCHSLFVRDFSAFSTVPLALKFVEKQDCSRNFFSTLALRDFHFQPHYPCQSQWFDQHSESSKADAQSAELSDSRFVEFRLSKVLSQTLQNVQVSRPSLYSVLKFCYKPTLMLFVRGTLILHPMLMSPHPIWVFLVF